MGLYAPRRNMIEFSSGPKILTEVPTEVWYLVLELAAYGGEHEFGGPDIINTELFWERRKFGFSHPRRAQRDAVRIRLNIIQVCQAWYSMGLKFLWSHLQFQWKTWKRDTSMWSSSLQSSVWSYVQRIDVICTSIPESESSRTTNDELCAFLNAEVFPRVPQLQVLCSPFYYLVEEYGLNLRAISLYPGGEFPPGDEDFADSSSAFMDDSFFWNGATQFWASAHVIELDLSITYPSPDLQDDQEVNFPNATKLCIRSIDSKFLANHIKSHWKMPKLRSLALLVTREADDDTWLPLLAWASGTIESLYLSAYHRSPMDDDIELPLLTSLMLEHCFCTEWAEFFQAPRLARIAFADERMDIMQARSPKRFTALLFHAMKTIPTCKELSYYQAEFNGNRRNIGGTQKTNKSLKLKFSFNPTNRDEWATLVQGGWLGPLAPCHFSHPIV